MLLHFRTKGPNLQQMSWDIDWVRLISIDSSIEAHTVRASSWKFNGSPDANGWDVSNDLENGEHK